MPTFPDWATEQENQQSAYAKSKDADQLCSYCTADQHLFFFNTKIVQFLFFFNPKFQASSLLVTAQAGLCWTWLETKIVVFSHVKAPTNLVLLRDLNLFDEYLQFCTE